LLVLCAALATAPHTAEAAAKVRCSSGVTIFLQDDVRIFGIAYRTSDEWGHDLWACRGKTAKPLGVGLEGSTTGTGSTDTPSFALGGGGRYLAGYHYTDGEGGPSAWFSAIDLKTRHSSGYANASCCDVVPEIRVAADGTMLTQDGEVYAQAPGAKNGTRLSTGNTTASDLALDGGTVYWTEHPDKPAPAVVRSSQLPGITDGPESLMLEPSAPRDKGGACRAAKGTTVVASSGVRVFERGTRRLACRVGHSGTVAIGTPGDPLPRIVKDRWVLAPATNATTVYDVRARKPVTTAEGAIAQATLLDDGTLAWLDPQGRLLAQGPGQDAPTELAPADPPPTALAASRTTIYWTAGGSPHGSTPKG
jgi:hypothetical protein